MIAEPLDDDDDHVEIDPKLRGLERLTLRRSEVCRLAGMSAEALKRAIVRGEFPRPAIVQGRIALWRRQSVTEWLADRSSTERSR